MLIYLWANNFVFKPTFKVFFKYLFIFIWWYFELLTIPEKLPINKFCCVWLITVLVFIFIFLSHFHCSYEFLILHPCSSVNIGGFQMYGRLSAIMMFVLCYNWPYWIIDDERSVQHLIIIKACGVENFMVVGI